MPRQTIRQCLLLPIAAVSLAGTAVPAHLQQGESPRKEFIYWTDDGSVAALRYNSSDAVSAPPAKLEDSL